MKINNDIINTSEEIERTFATIVSGKSKDVDQDIEKYKKLTMHMTKILNEAK